MRLSQKYVEALIDSLSFFIEVGCAAELRLYGSRTDDTLKGGDIDLLIVTEVGELARHLRQNKPEILGKIFSKIDEQKIDLLIVDRAELVKKTFAKKALAESVLIHRW